MLMAAISRSKSDVPVTVMIAHDRNRHTIFAKSDEDSCAYITFVTLRLPLADVVTMIDTRPCSGAGILIPWRL